ncbi:MAG TPA: DUF6491 family protein [Pseudomonadales bacterium]
MKISKSIVLGVASLALAACSVQGPKQDPVQMAAINAVKEAAPAGGCFYINRVDAVRAVNTEYLLLEAPVRTQAWLLELGPGCYTLNANSSVMLRGNNGQICGEAGDTVYTGEGNCAVISTRKVSNDDVARILEAK